MSITSDQKAHVVDLIRRKYPEWEHFEHRLFLRDEINTKRLTVKKATALLSESTLAHMLVTRETEAFIDRLERLGKATSLLERPETEHGDLEILYVPTLDKPVFCAQVYHLLHGTESAQDRLAAYLRYVEDHELPNSWTFPTYLLFFSNPRTEFFVEPQPTEWFLKYIGLSPYLGKPSAETYLAIKEFAHGLKHALAEYRPHDMIDIQSLIRVCAAASHSAPQPARATPPVAEEVAFWTDGSEDADATVLLPVNQEQTGAPSNSKPTPTEPVNGEDRPTTPLDQHYRVFLDSYMTSPSGIAAAVAFAKAREQAEQHFAHIVAEHELGEVVTERVFLHLLPHADKKEFVSSGAWIHPMPALDGSLNDLALLSSEEREQSAVAMLELTRQCVYNPRGMSSYIARFQQNTHAAPFQSRHISPLLHALKPGAFILATDEAISTINFFSGTTYSGRIEHYPSVNESGLALVRYLHGGARPFGVKSIQNTDLFALFCTWFATLQASRKTPTRKPIEVPDVDAPLSGDGGLPRQEPEVSPLPSVEEAPAPVESNAPGVSISEEVESRVENDEPVSVPTADAPMAEADVLASPTSAPTPTLSERETEALAEEARAIGKLLEEAATDPIDSSSNAYEEPAPDEESASTDPIAHVELVDVPEPAIEDRVLEPLPIDEPAEPTSPPPTARESEAGSEEPIYLTHTYLPDTDDASAPAPNEPAETPLPSAESLPALDMGEEVPDRSLLDTVAETTGYGADELTRWIETIRRKKQVILSGPPGTGKTFLARHLARLLAESGNGFVETLQLHPGYSYEDFIGQRLDERRDMDRPAMGHFTLFCEKAARRTSPCVLILDEINRADLNRVFGELVYLLEYRNESLALSTGRTLRVPDNAFLIGTMSAVAGAAIDPVLRRRFAFIQVPPRLDILRRHVERTGYDGTSLIALMERLNGHIEDPNRKLGIAYFMRGDLEEQLENIWRLEIEPWLESTFAHQPERLEAYRWERVRSSLA